MSNVIDRQIVEEGRRNAVVKLTGALDTSDAFEVPAIALGDFKDNEKAPIGKLVGLRVDYITFSVSNGIEVLLSWNGTNPQQIAPLAGRGKFDVCSDGGFVPDMTRNGYTGDINLTTTGFNTSGVNMQGYFTILLHCVKLYAPPTN